jgi:hypothetical protein
VLGETVDDGLLDKARVTRLSKIERLTNRDPGLRDHPRSVAPMGPRGTVHEEGMTEKDISGLTSGERTWTLEC